MEKANWVKLCVVVCAFALAIGLIVFFKTSEETRARKYMNHLNGQLNERLNQQFQAEWNYRTNITKHNQEIRDAAVAENAKFSKKLTKEILKFNFQSFKDEDLK